MRAFDAINNHRNIFIEMKKIDPEIEFRGRKNAIIKDLSEFPESRESYKQIFEHCNNPPGPIRMVVAVHSIRTKKSFTELKFDNPAMMRYLTDNFMHLKRNNSKQLIISTIGFIINVPVAFL